MTAGGLWKLTAAFKDGITHHNTGWKRRCWFGDRRVSLSISRDVWTEKRALTCCEAQDNTVHWRAHVWHDRRAAQAQCKRVDGSWLSTKIEMGSYQAKTINADADLVPRRGQRELGMLRRDQNGRGSEMETRNMSPSPPRLLSRSQQQQHKIASTGLRLASSISSVSTVSSLFTCRPPRDPDRLLEL